MSPLARGAYGQVFRGTFHPRRDAVTGDVIAIEFGYGAAPVSGGTGSRIGDTGAVTFDLGRAELAGREVPTLAAGEFRLMKLYDG